MKIKLTEHVMFPGGLKDPGESLEVEKEVGKDLVARKQATEVKQKKKRPNPPGDSA